MRDPRPGRGFFHAQPDGYRVLWADGNTVQIFPAERAAMRAYWNNYSLSIVLCSMFILAWGGQTIAGWKRFAMDQRQQGQSAAVLGNDGFIWHWLQSTLENWQAEFLQLFIIVVLTSHFVHKGSPQSKDGQERMQQTLERLELQVRDLAAQLAKPPS